MKIDVSEAKAFKACKRQWQLSSRNRMHLTPRVTPPQFEFGTLFHESLAELYLGVSLEKVMDMVRKEMRPETDAALLAMIPGYFRNVLPEDMERYEVLDIEHHFEIAPPTSEGELLFPLEHAKDPKTGELLYDDMGNPIMQSSVLICGSIDMICLDPEQNMIYGFEHKTCKTFRDSTYIWMDEQPRVYTWALKEYVRQYNQRRHTAWLDACAEQDHICATTGQIPVYPPEPVPAKLGGVYLNEVKKLLRSFQYQRTLCTYPEDDLDNFMKVFLSTCQQCKHMVDTDAYAPPQPSYFACQMCSFNTICATYMYGNIDKEEILQEFEEEFKVRDVDHLEEKAERSVQK